MFCLRSGTRVRLAGLRGKLLALALSALLSGFALPSSVCAQPAETPPAENLPVETPPELEAAAEPPAAAEPDEQDAAVAPPAAAQRSGGSTRLAVPQVAAQLKLTEEQRMAIAQLLVERAEALGAAGQDAARRDQVQQEYDKKLVAVLNDEQKAQWAELEAEPRLSFQFRFQKWSEVLEWFAEQSNLSLVMDAPPAGSFNYSDTRQYTPSEAIDLLNSVLLSKGYTLIRRDKMLILVDLTEGIPEGLIPRVDAAELERRGRFELVSVMFPLDGRPAEDVVTEVTPLLGPHGTAVALPKTGQVLVTDTAGVVRSIGSIIESMPKGRSESRRESPPSPVLTVYPVEGLEPAAVTETLAALFPSAKIVFDAQAQQLNVYAVPNEHTAIADILKRMQSGEPVDRRPRIEIYALPTTVPPRLAEDVQAILPTMRVTLDAAAGRLIAWGAPHEHERLKGLIEQLSAAGPGPGAPQLKFYDVAGDTTSLVSLLSRLVPSAQVIPQPEGNRLLVVAKESEHALVAETVQRVAELPAADTRRRLKIYPVTPAQRTRFMGVMGTLGSEMSDIRVVTDAQPGELAVWARPAQHEIVAQVLAELQVETPASAQYELRAYTLANVDVTTAQTTLATLLPEVRLIPETARRRLLAYTAPAIHERIATALQQIDQATTEPAAVLEVYPVPRADLSTVYYAVQPLAPQARIAMDVGSRSLLVWALPEDQQRIRTALEQVNQPGKGDSRQVKRFELERITGPAAYTMVQALVPRATSTYGPDGRSLIVWAEAQDLAAIEQLLAEVDPETSAAARQLIAYPLQSSALDTFMRAADPDLVREMQLTADTVHSTLLARGTPEQHADLKKQLDEFSQQLADAPMPEAVVYPLRNGDAYAAYSALVTVVPRARLAVDTVGNRLLATATAEEHELIKNLITQMDSGEAQSHRPVLRSYPLKSSNPTGLYTALTTVFARQRDVSLSLDPTSGTLIALASPQNHEVITKFLSDAEANGPTANEARAQIYPLGEAEGSEIVATLNTLFATQAGRVRVSHDRTSNQLIVVAPPEQQAVVAEVLSQLPKETRQLEVIALGDIDADTAEGAANRLFSHLGYRQSPTIEADSINQQLFVRGTAEQIEEIRGLLRKMGGAPAERQAVQNGGLRVVPFRGDTRAAVEQLRRVWPRLRANELRVLESGTSAPRERVPPAPVPEEPAEPDVPTPPASSDPSQCGPIVEPDEDAEIPVSTEAPPAVPTTESPRAVAPAPATAAAVEEPAENPAEASASPPAEATRDEIPADLPPGEVPLPPAVPLSVPPDVRDAPLIVVPGDGTITIASDDPEAVEQAEAILRALGGEGSESVEAARIGNNILVVPLRYTSAEAAAESIQGLVRGIGGFGRRGTLHGPIVAVPDRRLNAVVVFAHRADQAMVEGLLRTLDTPEAPESLVTLRPKLIPVKYAKVERVEEVIRAVYRTQMQAGGGRQPLPIPTGISADLAAVLQQANAAITGPLLTVSSDPVSNTLIVLAPQNLVDEITQLVAELDNADRNDPSRSLRVLEIQKVNSDTIQDALDILLDGESSRRSSGTRSRRSRR